MLSQQVKEAASVGQQAGLSLVESSILGAAAVLFLVVAALAVWQLSRVQNMRAEGADKHSKRMEALTEKMAGTFSKFDRTVDKLTDTVKQNNDSLRAQSDLLLQLKNSFDTTIRDMVLAERYRRSFTPGTRPAVKPEGG